MPRKKTILEEIPHSAEAEQGVLSSILIDNERISKVMGCMTAEDFYVPNHQELYNVITEEWQARRPIDLITLTQKLSDKGLLKQLGGAGAITSIYNFVPSSTNLDYYIEIIKNKTIARKTIQYCSEAIEKVRQAPDEMKDTLTNVQSGIGLIRPFYITQQRTFKDDVADKVERMQSGEPSADIVHTRITKLDHMSPLRLGDMVVIAGKRKSGKSILAITLEENILMTSDSAVLHFSLEDRRPKVVDRIFAGVSRIPMDAHHEKVMTEPQMKKAIDTATKLGASKFILHDDMFDLWQITAETKRVAVEHKNLKLVTVDYAQLVRAPYKKGVSREQEVAQVSRTLRLLSMELNIPILVLSQLNVEGDTRESKSLEQDCTAIWKIEMDEHDHDERYISIPFQRNGESGVGFQVTFIGNIARVENFAMEKI